MLNHVKITNFRSLVSVDVPLKPLTVLIGKNDSGKSTFLRALLILAGAKQLDGTEWPWREGSQGILVEGFLVGGSRVSWRAPASGNPTAGDFSGIKPAKIFQVPVQGAPMESGGYDDQSGAFPLESIRKGSLSL